MVMSPIQRGRERMLYSIEGGQSSDSEWKSGDGCSRIR